MNRLTCLLVLCCLAAAGLRAQSLDVAAGAGTVAAGHFLHNGFWPTLSATAWFGRWLGANSEFSIRSTDAIPGIQPWVGDVNLAFRPLTGVLQPEVLFGAGFYNSTGICSCPTPFGVTAYQANAVATYHLGLALKRYFHGRWFLLVDYGLYWSHSSGIGYPQRIAFQVGYSFGKL